MTNEEMIRIAMKQSAKDIGCRAEDFFRDDSIVVPLVLGYYSARVRKSSFVRKNGLSQNRKDRKSQ